MEYITVSIRMPKDLCDLLDDEALDGSRNRSQQFTHILKERYRAHAPPTVAKSKTPNGSTSTSRAKTKVTT